MAYDIGPEIAYCLRRSSIRERCLEMGACSTEPRNGVCVPKLMEKILSGLGVALFGALVFAAPADAVSSCAPSGLPTTCVIDAATNSNSLNQIGFPTTPFVTGRTFDAGASYVLTVANPSTTLWQTNAPAAGTTVDGSGGGLSIGSMVGQVGGAADSTGAFKISQVGAIATNGTVFGGYGATYAYTTGGALTLAVLDSDLTNNVGTQTVTITKAPTVGGNVLADKNVFGTTNGLGSGTPVNTSVALTLGDAYTVAVTDPNHLWSASGSDATRFSTADGLAAFPLCGPTANSLGETCGAAGSIGVGEAAAGFKYGELVALIGGKYYGIGDSRTFTVTDPTMSGQILYLLYWDSLSSDNAGAMNVYVTLNAVGLPLPPGGSPGLGPTPAPEPGTLALLGGGLAALGWLRRRRA